MGPFLMRGWLYLSLAACCWSCVGTQKYKALAAEQSKTEQTLLETKTQLSQAKRDLNKLQDAASSAQAQQDASIGDLNKMLLQTQTLLRQAQQKNSTLAQQLEQNQVQQEETTKRLNQRLAPFLTLQNQLTKEQRTLRTVDQALQQLLADNALEGVSTALLPGRLVIRLDNGVFFGRSNSTITSKGKASLVQLAVLLQQHPTPFVDIKGNAMPGSNTLNNWKNSTRQPLAVVYALLKEEVKPERFRLIGQGEYWPLTNDNSNRTELVLHFQPERVLERIPLR